MINVVHGTVESLDERSSDRKISMKCVGQCHFHKAQSLEPIKFLLIRQNVTNNTKNPDNTVTSCKLLKIVFTPTQRFPVQLRCSLQKQKMMSHRSNYDIIINYNYPMGHYMTNTRVLLFPSLSVSSIQFNLLEAHNFLSIND